MNHLRVYLNDFLALLFPQLCQACNCNLAGQENLLCTTCLYNLPYTNFHRQADHIVARQFWGKIELKASYALLYFTKGGSVQNLIHNFKYRNRPQIGNMLGQLAGRQLADTKSFKTVDLIIPVPLHPSRLHKRGYNQSEMYAAGIAEKLNSTVSTKNLVRIKATETQTHKSRLARYENVKSVFGIRNPQDLAGKHILLVDDIVTTGSTLEACGRMLLDVDGVTLSIATIAYAE